MSTDTSLLELFEAFILQPWLGAAPASCLVADRGTCPAEGHPARPQQHPRGHHGRGARPCGGGLFFGSGELVAAVRYNGCAPHAGTDDRQTIGGRWTNDHDPRRNGSVCQWNTCASFPTTCGPAFARGVRTLRVAPCVFESGRISGRPPLGEARNLLAGLATCAVCGGGLVVETSSRKRGRVKEYVCHRRRKNGSCSNVLRVSADVMNEAVLQAIEEHALTPKRLNR